MTDAREKVLHRPHIGRHAYVGRQPIFDERLRVAAYELLHRSAEGPNQSAYSNPDRATSDLLLNTFAELGIERVVFDKLAFINVTASVIGGDIAIPGVPQRIVLKVGELDVNDPRCAQGIKARLAEGFAVCLGAYTEELQPFLKYCEYACLDFQSLGAERTTELAQQLRDLKCSPIIVGLERGEDYDAVQESGARLFQGRFLMHPQLVVGRRVPRSVSVMAQVLMELYDPDVDIRRVEDLVKLDAGLVAALLRFLNSAAHGLSCKVSTVRQAITLLGLNDFGRWVTLLSLSEGNSQPGAILMTALIRARTCENVSKRENLGSSVKAFSVGLLSTLDALLQTPMDNALEALPISDEIKGAIRRYEGPCGEILKAVMAHEAGQDHDEVVVTQPNLHESWLEALGYADQYSELLSK